jgi:hypothetical protein
MKFKPYKPYKGLEANYFDERRKHLQIKRLRSKEQLGYKVSLEPTPLTTTCFATSRLFLNNKQSYKSNIWEEANIKDKNLDNSSNLYPC